MNSPHVPRQLFVRYCPETDEADRTATNLRAGASETKRYHIVEGLTLVDIPDGDLARALSAYDDDPNVAYAEPNYVMYPGDEPDDPLFSEQWSLYDTVAPIADIRALNAWAFWTGDPDFRIAVIDTGMNYNHTDLAANMWTNPGEVPDDEIDNDENGYVDDIHGYDTLDEDGDPISEGSEFHATVIAGIIAAETDNGASMAGINWQADIVALRASAGNSMTVDNACEAIQYAIDNDIKLSNYSFGGSGSCPGTMFDAIQAARDEIGHLFVAIAHNSNKDIDQNPLFPCTCDLDNIILILCLTPVRKYGMC